MAGIGLSIKSLGLMKLCIPFHRMLLGNSRASCKSAIAVKFFVHVIVSRLVDKKIQPAPGDNPPRILGGNYGRRMLA